MEINFILGRAGTGKTEYIKRSISQKISDPRKKIICLAYTHSAVRNLRERIGNAEKIEFKTLHSFFRISPDNMPRGPLKLFNFVYIDEISLIDKTMLERCLLSLISLNKTKEKINVYLVGDVLQLGAVNTSEQSETIDRKTLAKLLTATELTSNTKEQTSETLTEINKRLDVIFHLSRLPVFSDFVEKYKGQTIILRKNFRQNNYLINLLNSIIFRNDLKEIIKNAIPFRAAVEMLRQSLSEPAECPKVVFIASTYNTLKNVNFKVRENFGETFENHGFLFTSGETVYITKNETNRNASESTYKNGDFFKIVEKGGVIIYEKNDKLKNKNKIIFDNPPAVPAYLYTFHKSQGLEFSSVIICVDNLFLFPMLYTGITRAHSGERLNGNLNPVYFTSVFHDLPGMSPDYLAKIINTGGDEIRAINRIFYDNPASD